ncbi:uncharacterized protein METZ01_LOCUS444712, partial [marine metagenome]
VVHHVLPVLDSDHSQSQDAQNEEVPHQPSCGGSERLDYRVLYAA